MNRKNLLLIPLAAFLLTGCITVVQEGSDQTATSEVINPNPNLETVDELVIEDIEIGDGEEALPNSLITVHYTGTLTDGSKFDSSLEGEPFTVPLGQGNVIKGWDEGIVGMKVGGKRRLTIPADLAYGDQGSPPVIPPGATLVFEIELLEVRNN
jgi:FKBP-type peptidyl-prolyl cis-trans isomerase